MRKKQRTHAKPTKRRKRPSRAKPASQKKRQYTRRTSQKAKDLTFEAYHLKSLGLSIRRIGQKLGVGKSTVHDLIKRSEFYDESEIKVLTSEMVATSVQKMSEERVRAIWNLHNATSNASVRLGCINAVRAEVEHVVKHHQELGVLKRQPQEIKAEVKHSDARTPTPAIDYGDPSAGRNRLKDLLERLPGTGQAPLLPSV